MKDLIYKHALKNALDYGNAEPQAVLKKVLVEERKYREDIKKLLPLIKDVVEKVNTLSKKEIESKISRYEFFQKEKKRRGLTELPKAKKVKLRFAPNPSGPLHIGHSRAAILNDEYAKLYNGELILRIEDTDPRRVDINAYDDIKEELKWLGVKWKDEIIQSKRLELYYKYAQKLIEDRHAYVCTCKAEDFKILREGMKSCPCRGLKTRKNLERFARMFEEYKEGEVVLRVKTNLNHPNPSLREFPIMRIVQKEHPLVGDRRVYPLYNFAVTIDDYLQGITHVLRGKDHIINTEKQVLIYKYFNWDAPTFIHYGILKIEGLALSTSEIGKGIKEGKYRGWNDIRLGTIKALRRRGIQPGAIRKVIIDVGVKESDINFSWKNLYAHNRGIIEPKANRYFFVDTPRALIVHNSIEKIAKNPLHPDFPERGVRNIHIKPTKGKAKIFIANDDFKKLKEGELLRLMGAFNVEIIKKDSRIEATYHSEDLKIARRKKAKLIHWIPEKNIKIKVISPEKVYSGYGEEGLKEVKVGDIIQFERFGFVRIDERNEGLTACFAHK